MTRRLSVRRDADVDDALATLAASGWTASDATRYALRLLADAHIGSYDAGLVPVGHPVDVVATTVEARHTPMEERP
jgi:hypothetical protein